MLEQVTHRCYQWPVASHDSFIKRHQGGRVLEILSEHTCQVLFPSLFFPLCFVLQKNIPVGPSFSTVVRACPCINRAGCKGMR